VPARTVEVACRDELFRAIDSRKAQLRIDTDKDLALRAGVSSEWISKARNPDKHRVDLATLRKVSSALAWPPTSLEQVAAGDAVLEELPADVPPGAAAKDAIDSRFEKLEGEIGAVRQLVEKLLRDARQQPK
jgi:hypothetical protein